MKRVLILAIAVMLSSCSEQRQFKGDEAYEFAKSHVWGDKINGCDYQKISFDEKYVTTINSLNMINYIKKVDKNFKISPINRYEIKKVMNYGNKFILFFKNGGSTYKIQGDEIQWYSTDTEGKMLLTRSNRIYPTDFVICD